MEKLNETIIINRMYAGGYLDLNIGHEIINTYKTDAGENYIYINPWGTIRKKESNVQYVYLVRAISQHCFEVIAVAGELDLLLTSKAFECKKQRDIGLKDFDEQQKIIKENRVCYGRIPVDALFADQGKQIYLTFRANKMMSIDETNKIYIYDDKSLATGPNDYYIPGITFSRQSLKMYVNNSEKSSQAYDVLYNLAESLKHDNYQNKTFPVNLEKKLDDTFSLVDILGQANDELSYSNWIFYYINNDRELFKAFTKEVLDVILDEQNSELKREYHNVDLWIEDANNVVVIENKIKSGINGIDQKRHDIKNGNVQSQLSKYVVLAENEAKKDNKIRETNFYIFLPNYSYRDDELKNYLCGEKYKIIRYSMLLSFFESHKCNLPYYADFLKAIKKHSVPYKKDLFEVMDERLIEKIKAISSK